MKDTDLGWQFFLDACVAAGPKGCALYDASTDLISARLENLYTSLKQRPIPIFPPADKIDSKLASIDYGTLDYGFTRRVIFGFLYQPFLSPLNATALASALSAAEKGDGYPMWQLHKEAQPEFDCKCGTPSATRPASGRQLLEAIACSDGDTVDDSFEDLYKHYARMASDSSFAEWWWMRLECSYVSVMIKLHASANHDNLGHGELVPRNDSLVRYPLSRLELKLTSPHQGHLLAILPILFYLLAMLLIPLHL
jgi:hypothetical protein